MPPGAEKRVGENEQYRPANAMQNRIDNPKNSQQVQVMFHAVGLLDISHQHLSTFTAHRLTGLHLDATTIAEHRRPPHPVGMA